jgi:hypothetical protein
MIGRERFSKEPDAEDAPSCGMLELVIGSASLILKLDFLCRPKA